MENKGRVKGDVLLLRYFGSTQAERFRSHSWTEVGPNQRK